MDSHAAPPDSLTVAMQVCERRCADRFRPSQGVSPDGYFLAGEKSWLLKFDCVGRLMAM
jgi:hypothetical protein